MGYARMGTGNCEGTHAFHELATKTRSLLMSQPRLRCLSPMRNSTRDTRRQAPRRLSEQVRRNRYLFPSDFAFLLTGQEFAKSKSRFATST